MHNLLNIQLTRFERLEAIWLTILYPDRKFVIVFCTERNSRTSGGCRFSLPAGPGTDRCVLPPRICRPRRGRAVLLNTGRNPNCSRLGGWNRPRLLSGLFR